MVRPIPSPSYGRARNARRKPKPRNSPVQTSVEQAGLTPREWAAVNWYFHPEVNYNKVEACRRAKYAHPRSQAHRIFGRPAVVAEIERRRAEMAVEMDLGPADVLNEFRKMAFFNIADYGEVDPETGEFVFNLNDLSREQLAAITGIKYDKQGRMVVETSKLEALEKLARNLGLFNDKLHLDASDDLAQAILKAKERVGKE